MMISINCILIWGDYSHIITFILIIKGFFLLVILTYWRNWVIIEYTFVSILWFGLFWSSIWTIGLRGMRIIISITLMTYDFAKSVLYILPFYIEILMFMFFLGFILVLILLIAILFVKLFAFGFLIILFIISIRWNFIAKRDIFDLLLTFQRSYNVSIVSVSKLILTLILWIT